MKFLLNWGEGTITRCIRKRGTSLFSYCAYPGLFYLIFDGSPPFGPLKIDGFGPTLYNDNIMTNNRQKPRISQEN